MTELSQQLNFEKKGWQSMDVPPFIHDEHMKIEGHNLKQSVYLGALRWLHAIDLDPSSKSYGLVDREYWSWKTKDFANATWQGGLAGLLDAHELLNLPHESIVKIVGATISGTKLLQKSNGSFEEAYPWESSACVTALVLFNLLYAYNLYPQYFNQNLQETLKIIVKQSFHFLDKTPETHGEIANHKATIIFAKRMARRFLGVLEDNEELYHFLNLQHLKENWFPEYGGADPGYQTLLNHYIIAGAYALNELELVKIFMKKSLEFVSIFCFPDGTYSGEIGSRGTSIVYPSGFLSFEKGKIVRNSWSAQWFLSQHQKIMDAVTPLTVDGPNFVPVFNSWAFFSKICSETTHFPHHALDKDIDQGEHFLKDAGLLIKRSKNAYLAISFNNGCIRRGIKTDKAKWTDRTIAALTFHNWTTQGVSIENLKRKGNLLSWQYRAIKRKQILNTPAKLMILRFLSLSVFHFPLFQRVLKKILVSYIMKSQKIRSTPIVVQINLNTPQLTLKILNNSNETWEPHTFGFHQHMASANTFSGRQLL